MTFAVVLDKSYLDGARRASVRHLCDNYTVLLSDELFYELMTTRPDSRKHCFSKLPERQNPVRLVPNVGALIRFEREHKEACTPIIRQCFGDDYVFNRLLREGTYVLNGEVDDKLQRLKAQVAADTRVLIDRWPTVHGFFPELNGIEWNDFPNAVQTARRKVATDINFVREIYASCLDEDARRDSPAPADLDSRWAIFRSIQCNILCDLRLFGRYQGKPPVEFSEVFVTKAEHSMLDTSYVILGSLTGAMATNDGEILEDLLLLCPDCFLVSPKTVIDTGANSLQGTRDEAERH